MTTEQALPATPSNLSSGMVSAPDSNEATPTKQQGLNFAPLLRVVQRNILLITGIAVVVAASQAYSGLKSPRVYQGNFRILVEPISSQGRSTDPSAISRAQASDPNIVDYASLLQVLQSPELMDKIASQIQVRYPDVTASSLLQEIFTKSLVIERIAPDPYNPTKLLQVSYKGRDPQRVQFILEEVQKGFLRYSLDDRKSRIGGGVEFIEDQLPSLQQRVNQLEAQLQALKQRYRLSDPGSESSAVSGQLREVRNLRLLTERELAEQNRLFNLARQQLNFTPDEALQAASLSENPRYQSALTQLKTIEAQIAVKSARFTPESPVLQGLLEQQQKLTSFLNREALETLGRIPAQGATVSPKVRGFQNSIRLDLIKQLVSTANAIQLLQVRLQSVSQTEALMDRQLQAFPAIVRQYNDYQQQLDIATKTLTQFLTQRETLRLEAAQKEVPWQVIAAPKLLQDSMGNPAPLPNDFGKKAMTGLIAGILLGAAAAFLKEKLGNVFYSSDDVKDGIAAPQLGVIPRKPDLNQTGSSVTNLAGDSFSKAFISLYTNLRFLSLTSPVKSVVVGSASPGDGKTTTAIHLALAAVAMGRRVLLVDTNLRYPQIHASLGLSNGLGLGDLLQQKTDPEMAIQQSPLDKNLFVLPAGQPIQDSARLLASAGMQSLMQQFHASYDLVIYDTANLSEYADTNFLTAQADGLLFVVGVRQTKRSLINRVIGDLNKFRLPILGVVANHPKRGPIASSSRNYLPGEDYGNQPALLENLKILKPSVSSPTNQPGDVLR